MIRALIALSALLASVALLLTGNGLLGTLLALRGDSEGFDTQLIGVIMAAYFAGFFTGCFTAPILVRRVGHIRVFAGLAAIAAALALLHVLVVDAYFWALFRFLSGICFAGLYMVIESWMNEAADNSNRGTVISVYTLVDRAAILTSQLLLGLASPESFPLFALAAMLVTLALVPTSLAATRAPAPIGKAKLRMGRLFRISPAGVFGCVAVGLANAAFMSLGPLYAGQLGMTAQGVGLFMASVILGGAVSQWPLGYLSDRMDRRLLMVIVGLAAVVTAFGLSFAASFGLPDEAGATPWLIYLAAAAVGASILPLYPLAIAHANDFMEPEDFVEASGGLLLSYGGGAAIGPLIGAALMTEFGPEGLLYHLAAIHGLFVLFVLYRRTRRDAPSEEDKTDFVSVPRSTPVVFEGDPRSPEEPEDGVSSEEVVSSDDEPEPVQPSPDQPKSD